VLQKKYELENYKCIGLILLDLKKNRIHGLESAKKKKAINRKSACYSFDLNQVPPTYKSETLQIFRC
jgi:hypothetical protein